MKHIRVLKLGVGIFVSVLSLMTFFAFHEASNVQVSAGRIEVLKNNIVLEDRGGAIRVHDTDLICIRIYPADKSKVQMINDSVLVRGWMHRQNQQQVQQRPATFSLPSIKNKDQIEHTIAPERSGVYAEYSFYTGQVTYLHGKDFYAYLPIAFRPYTGFKRKITFYFIQ